MTRPLVRLALAASATAALTLALLGCSSTDARRTPSCGPPEDAAEVSAWWHCDAPPSAGGTVRLFLTNGTSEPAWTYHHCEGRVPWLARLEAGGQWQALLPEGFSLPLACEHVEVVDPGATLELAVIEVPAAAGTYRVETVIGWECGHLHDPRHLPGTCQRTETLPGTPFELR